MTSPAFRTVPGPLEVRAGKSTHVSIYIEGTPHNVAVGVKRKDADAIVKACNNHDLLVGALNDVLHHQVYGTTTSLPLSIERAREVLKQVKKS